ncbi:DMT family transporter [bacterium]|jgi:drug/metabolite transporter (DMT)-like permease|nr:DMT family transporter [bacterium]
MFWLIIVNAFFASTFTIGRSALELFKPEFFIGIRMFFAGLLLFGYWKLFGARQANDIRKNLGNLIGYALVGITASYLTEFWALARMTSCRATLINGFAPFISAIISYLFLSEKLNRKKWLALAIGFVGFVPIIMMETTSFSELISASVADFVFFISVVTYTLGWIFMRALVQKGFSPLFVNAVAMFTAGVISLGISFVTGSYNQIPSLTSLIQHEVAIVIIGNFICYNAFGYLLKYYTATLVTLSGLVLPVFGALYGWYFLGEVVTYHYLISFVILSVAMYLFYKEEIAQGV